jgi:hypothetical protein
LKTSKYGHLKTLQLIPTTTPNKKRKKQGKDT